MARAEVASGALCAPGNAMVALFGVGSDWDLVGILDRVPAVLVERAHWPGPMVTRIARLPKRH